MSDQKKNILQRINDVRKSIGYLQKDKSVSTGGGSYRAITHDVVTGMVRQHMIDAGIVCVPNLVASCAHPKEEGVKQFRYDATYEFVFANEDDPKDFVSIKIEAHAMDNADKAPGKALSYAKKYAMLKLFEIETGEDDESRYQQEEFDILSHVDLILESPNEAELRKRYAASYKAAGEAKNKEAMKAIIAAKDKAKKALGGGMEGQA